MSGTSPGLRSARACWRAAPGVPRFWICRGCFPGAGALSHAGRLKQNRSPADQLSALRPDPDKVDRRLADLLDSLDVVAGLARQVLPLAAIREVGLPARHLLEDRLAVLQPGDVRHRVIPNLVAEAVTGADPEALHLAEDVDLHQCDRAGAVDPRGVARDRAVEPHHPAGADSHGAVFATALTDSLA